MFCGKSHTGIKIRIVDVDLIYKIKKIRKEKGWVLTPPTLGIAFNNAYVAPWA